MATYSTRSKSNAKLGSLNPTLFEYPEDEEQLETGKSVITFTRHDQRQLQTPRFFNDTIITFFMQYYLDTRIAPEISEKTHIFNSFFFQKLKCTREKRLINMTSYYWASKWLNGVKIFDKDFLVLPVCEKEHWILVIVCYGYNEPSRRNEMIADEKLYEPAVLVLNSCHGLAPTLKRTLQKFLEYQWQKERGTERSFSIQNAKCNGIRLVFPELPQQKNSFDCGVYVLNYFYCFLRDPRKAYVKMFRGHSMKNWFKDNKVDTSWERRRMATIVKERISRWKELHKQTESLDRNTRNQLEYIGASSSSQDDEDQEDNNNNNNQNGHDQDSSSSCNMIELVDENDAVNGNHQIIVIH